MSTIIFSVTISACYRASVRSTRKGHTHIIVIIRRTTISFHDSGPFNRRGLSRVLESGPLVCHSRKPIPHDKDTSSESRTGETGRIRSIYGGLRTMNVPRRRPEPIVVDSHAQTLLMPGFERFRPLQRTDSVAVPAICEITV